VQRVASEEERRTYLGVAVVDDIAGGDLRGGHVDRICVCVWCERVCYLSW